MLPASFEKTQRQMEKQIKEIDIWKKIRERLNNNYSLSEDWDTAISMFCKRIESKYLNPIEDFTNKNSRKGEGFVIVTIQCALIETFAAFKKGLIYNHNKPSEGGSGYEYRESSNLFVNFLNNEDIFKGIFFVIDKNNNKQINTPFSGSQFYSQVRCGLMHEAKTKGKWHINATKTDDINDKKIIKSIIKGNIIYRTLLHHSLKEYLLQYKSELEDIQSNNLRRLFARKLDDLYEIKDEYEWWNKYTYR